MNDLVVGIAAGLKIRTKFARKQSVFLVPPSIYDNSVLTITLEVQET